MEREEHMSIVTKSVRLPAEVWNAIDEYRHAARIKAESQAVRLVIQAGLKALAADRGAS